MISRSGLRTAALGIAIALLIFGSREAAAAQRQAGVTYTTVPGETALRGKPSGRLLVMVWYPAPAHTPVRPIALGPPADPYFLEGQAAQNAPLANLPARMPLIVV